MAIKRTLIAILSAVVYFTITAQDIISTTNGASIKAKIVEITENTVRYQNYNSTSGSIYTLPISSISHIQYENGSTKIFNQKAETGTPVIPENKSNYNNNLQEQSNRLSDTQLLALLNKEVSQPSSIIYAKANKYKRIGLIGGLSIAIGGTAISAAIALINQYPGSWSSQFPAVAAGSIAAGAIWYGSFYLAANHQLKKINQSDIYSYTIIGEPVYDNETTSLIAGLNVLGNDVTKARSLGIGLTLNF